MESPRYIWQSSDWPRFRWDEASLIGGLSEARLRQGRLLGRVGSIGLPLEQEARFRILMEEAIKTSEVEGDRLDPAAVRSSVARRLGLPHAGLPQDRRVDGLVEVLLDATRNSDAPLTVKRLHGWHAALFPTGVSGLRRIRAGAWRNRSVRIVSGAIGRERVHYEGSPPEEVSGHMRAFLAWFRESRGVMEGLLRAGLAHLWLVLIHPFDDGNGRIARALADMAAAQDDRQPYRYYSLSSQIMHQRDDYYAVLEKISRGTMDVTPWLVWFLGCFTRSIARSEESLSTTFARARFWSLHEGRHLSERQRKAVGKMLEAGPGGFEGGLTTRKYVAMTRASRATAFRELEELRSWGILGRTGSGRSVRYELVWPDNVSRD